MSIAVLLSSVACGHEDPKDGSAGPGNEAQRGTLFSDDFRDSELNPAWIFVDPVGDGSFALTGQGTPDAWLNIVVPTGISHDPHGINRAPRLMQPVDDIDLHVEVKFESLPSETFQMQGIVLEETEQRFLRVDVYGDAGEVRLYVAGYVDGVNTVYAHQPLSAANQVFLRVSRKSNAFTVLTSNDGADWIERATFEHTLELHAAGIMAGNAGGNPAFTASVDYFMNLDEPLDEDPFECDPAVHQARVQVLRRGVGQVDSSVPLGTDVPCDTQVTLVATPLPGWRFRGWSGIPSSSEIQDEEVSFAASGQLTVMAIFEPSPEDPFPGPPRARGFSVETTRSSDSIGVHLQMDAAVSARLHYGKTPDLELGALESAESGPQQTFQLDELTPLSTYFVQIEMGEGATRKQSDVFAVTTLDSTEQPATIEFWHVPPDVAHRFGHIGRGQRWANLLGHAAGSPHELHYSLNGGAELPLGPSPRLNQSGDFNVELDFDALHSGLNYVTVHARYSDSSEAVATAVVWKEERAWPLPYTLHWSENSIRDPQDALQIVDGKWALTSQGLRTLEPGYDRALAIGDASWTNYEITAEVLVHGVGVGSGVASGIRHIGVALRWPGHQDWGGAQPRLGWHPYGALLTYTWLDTPAGYDFFAPNGDIFERTWGEPPITGEPYFMKALIRDTPQGDVAFGFKLWRRSDPEPDAWSIHGLSNVTTVAPLASGGALFVAHYTDITYGNLWALPVE